MKKITSYFSFNLFLSLAVYCITSSSTSLQVINLSTADADQILAAFDQQIEWFLVYQKEFLLKNEESFKKFGEWEEASENNQTKKETILQLKKEFLQFRDRFIQQLSSMNSHATYSRVLIEHARDQITREFIKLIQDCVFPSKWELIFKEYLNQENRVPD